MFISSAYAQAVEVGSEVMTTPSTGETFMVNVGLILLLVAMFWFLLIRPQQKRFKEHADMLSALKKGDKVITGGGLIGSIEKISDDSNEVVVNLGGGMKVTALRSTIQTKNNDLKTPAPANDEKSKKTKKKS